MRGGVASTPTRGRYMGMGGRDEDADKGGDTWEMGKRDEDADKGGIFKRGSGTGRYAQVQTGALYRVMHVPLANQGGHARRAST